MMARANSSLSNPRVALVVSGDSELRKICKDSALGAGFSVECVDKGVAALNMARKLLPEVILLDVELRDVNGFELVTWLGADAKLRHVPVIAFSTFASDIRDLRNETGRGKVTLLSKPFQSKDLDKLVRKMI